MKLYLIVVKKKTNTYFSLISFNYFFLIVIDILVQFLYKEICFFFKLNEFKEKENFVIW